MSNIIMNIDQKLPREAYVALQALKDQASSVSSDDFIVDKEELKAAQSKMSEVDSWTKAIYRKLIASKGAVTIDDIDSSWLESQFI